ncbi:hypothetical protein Ddye_018240 [Dipteronia dyeriana]|uniref:Uncharacterized protein n=1 Tax=Dipteronia dyeriana TaxID=168575 RepID=A0AAD9UAP2_9ROSI|nr:hypothetical protein Ddye_018240 [Dipteronia dyeriana]
MEIMAENEHKSRDYWLIDNVQGKKFEEVLDPAPNCCIYKVPQCLRKINEEAYTPSLISIGPLHYAREELMGMENQKKRYWSKFGERVNAQKLEELETYIKNQEKHIRDHYSVASKLGSSEYVAMILHDAVFIIELFLRKYRNTDDFLLKRPLIITIMSDLQLLENQLPYSVLDDLFTKAFPNEVSLSFFNLQCSFFRMRPILSISKEPQVKHFTDFIRCAFVMEVQTTMQSKGGHLFDLPNATKLKESGLKFRGLKNKRLLDINLVKRKHGKWLPWFALNELQIPRIVIYDNTECLFRNLMALEMFHYPTQTHICNYAVLMDYLIDTAKDVELLIEKEIIVNCVGENEAIAKMFNRLCSHMILSDSCYFDTAKKIKAHYKSPWNHLKATLKSVYFGNLWTGTATVAAAFLLILTAAQTVFSIMQL